MRDIEGRSYWVERKDYYVGERIGNEIELSI
jgi:hypothetical protein